MRPTLLSGCLLSPWREAPGHLTCLLETKHDTACEAARCLFLLPSVAAFGPADAQEESVEERFAGETQIESQSPLPIHLELRRVGAAIEGTIAIPMGRFNIVAYGQDNAIIGQFTGSAGEGTLNLAIAGEALTGTLTLGEARGTDLRRAHHTRRRGIFLGLPK
tara:strand:- start:3654 stop:4142 length:489 start_codon:yes stop_codon:yes gene_type:complete